ncbi:hypothetical protein N7474_004053 [Penicillium riverlandense]|uniref:uncharacterized protein n=1 Tax=Penicillium riverlandense TaxID=1903569 RepID=UPI00254689D7|nr:uncharacterized protein N7474_004053 [Penicillium riverlandense]KAJ5818462.1 hypothetical protein N7474_004053 [Penicillium riverlandense]
MGFDRSFLSSKWRRPCDMLGMIFSKFPSPHRLAFAIVVVSALSSKFLHLYQHLRAGDAHLLAIYFPTFFIQEIFLFSAVWALLYTSWGWLSVCAVTVTSILAYVILMAASSQISFYYATGGEIRWDAAKSVGNSRPGMMLILSGLGPTIAAATVMLIISLLLAAWIYPLMTKWMCSVFSKWLDDSEEQLPGADNSGAPSSRGRTWTVRVAIVTLLLWIIRPAVPYNHISGALPFVMFAGAASHSVKPQPGVMAPFPFPELLEKVYWEPPNGNYKGWSPGSTNLTELPAWASEYLPTGFERWKDPHGNRALRNSYDPTSDPLRINNLNLGLLGPLEEALKERDIPITHIVMVMMESGRQDMFPFKAGSRVHDHILEAWESSSKETPEDLDEILSQLTPVAEMLTGQASGFNSSAEVASQNSGGINIEGVTTGSTLSSKARIVDYCGVQALPVDFMAEMDTKSYQPCLMQVLELFNQLKQKETDEMDPRERLWNTIYAQSVTGQFKAQDKLITKLGFKQALYSEDIEKTESKYYHKMEKINYFGYAEEEIRPYLKDMIRDTIDNNQRLFLSHFTSTTHHPWGVPSKFKKKEYIPHSQAFSKHERLDAYLNTIRYVDNWLGQFMDLLHEEGIANETLTVFVGDHGQAFDEDSSMTGTYQNGHISNFAVPLTLHHPLLPRIQIVANATTISILPTILDLLTSTKSLNEADTEIALDLANQYEGQSLIRPYINSHLGREAWKFAIINAGGTMLSIGSAAVPYRLILPLAVDFEFRFTHGELDFYEEEPIVEWDIDSLTGRVQEKYGDEAANWASRAQMVGVWWITERMRLWDFHPKDFA